MRNLTEARRNPIDAADVTACNHDPLMDAYPVARARGVDRSSPAAVMVRVSVGTGAPMRGRPGGRRPALAPGVGGGGDAGETTVAGARVSDPGPNPESGAGETHERA